MKRADLLKRGKSGLELAEEAVHLVRTAPAAALASYYVGTLPFVLGWLYFWIAMSRSPFAGRQLAGAALGMALLFLWMKCWQAVFARRLRAALSGAPAEPFGFHRCRRMFVVLTALQPAGLFLLPLAAVTVAPLAWTYCFFQNLTVLADGEHSELGPLLRKAAGQTLLWSRQNLSLLGILAGFGLFIFLDWAMVCLLLPKLFKTLLGVESIFNRSPRSLLNSTFLMAMAGLTYLCLDPILKAAYTLRCFYGESLLSGEDLKAELRRLSRKAQPLVAGAIVLGALIYPTDRASWSGAPRIKDRHTRAFRSPSPRARGRNLGPAVWISTGVDTLAGKGQPCSVVEQFVAVPAPEVAPPRAAADIFSLSPGERAGVRGCSCRRALAASAGLPPGPHRGLLPLRARRLTASTSRAEPELRAPALDRAIQETLQQDKYLWRAPREAGLESGENGLLDRLRERVSDAVKRGLKGLGDWLDRWLRRLFGGSRQTAPSAAGIDWASAMQGLLYVLIALAASGLGILLYRSWAARRRSESVTASQPQPAAPDLSAENVGADQLPEDGWLKLAGELRERGESRLAMRAFYLAGLANLAERNLISLAKFKSNRDYERELGRRGHAFPGMLALFGESTSIFERIWYGFHEARPEAVEKVAANVEQIRSTT